MTRRRSLAESDRQILRLARESASDGVFQVAQTEISERLGIGRVSIARSLKRLRGAGILVAEDPFARPISYRLNPEALPPEMGE